MEPALTWVADVPLLTNPVILRAMVLVLGLGYVLVTAIFAVILAIDDRLEHLPSFLLVMLIGFGIVAAMLMFVMLVVFRNRMRCRFIIDDEGVASMVVDRMAMIGGSLAIMAGAASGNAVVAGAGLGSLGSRPEYTSWSRVSGAEYFSDRCFIRLKPTCWWPVGAIHCTAESYPAVAEKVCRILERRGT